MIAASVILTLGGALAVSLGLTRLMIWLGPRLGLLNMPVPRSGGIAVWVSFLSIGLLVLIALPVSGALNWSWFRAFAVASGLLVLLIDVILAIWRRSARQWLAQRGLGHSVSVFGADKDHLHHRLLKLGLTQRKVALLFYVAAICASLVAILLLLLGGQAAGFTVTAVIVGAIVGLRYLAPIELSTSGKVLHLALTRPVGSRLMVLGYFCFDALAILLALAIALMVENSGGFAWLSREDLLQIIAVTMGSGLCGLRMAKAHSRHWARGSIRDYWALVLWFAVSMHIAFTITMLLARDPAWASGRVFLMTTTFAVPALLLPRSVTPLIREALIDSRHRRLISSRSRQKRILLYGAGDLGELFLSHLKTTAPTEMEEMCIVGFIDDRPHLRRKILDGFRIRGSVQHLAALADRHELHGVLLTVSRLEPDAAAELNRICDEKGLALYRWRPQLRFREIAPQDLGGEERVAVGSDVFRGPRAAHPAPEVVAVP